MVKSILQKVLPHFVAVAVFLTISLVYFSPVLDGYVLKQHDIEGHKGMAKEIMDHREMYDEEPLWTNSMFSGMPATQVSVKYPGNFLEHVDKLMTLWLPNPANYFFLYMLGFYILLILLKADPWVAACGAVAYGFTAYFFQIMGAGHNSKAHAIAYLAPMIGSIIYTLRGKYILGAALTMLFLSLELRANHVQITYYSMILVIGIVIYFLVKSIRDKALPSFGKAMGFLAIAGVLAVLPNVPNLYGTYEYTPYTIRGGSELTIAPDGKAKEEQPDLSFEYITHWSMGQQESFSLLFPNVKGSSGALLGDKEFMEADGNDNLKQYLRSVEGFIYQSTRDSQTLTKTYFGDQPGTSPRYVGAIVFALFILAMVFIESGIKWAVFFASLLILMLSWGKNYPGLTHWFIDNFPMYGKFRAVTIILTVLELSIPMLGFMWLIDLVKKKSGKDAVEGDVKFLGSLGLANKLNKSISFKKLFLIGSGSIVGVMLLIYATPGTFFSFQSSAEKEAGWMSQEYVNSALTYAINTPSGQQMAAQNGMQPEQLKQRMLSNVSSILPAAKEELISYREGVFKADLGRSLLFIVLAMILIYLYAFTKLDKRIFVGGLGLLILIDMWPIAGRYLDSAEIETGTDSYMGWQQSFYNAYGRQPGSDDIAYEKWYKNSEKLMPYDASKADLGILKYEASRDEEIAKAIANAQTEVDADEELKRRAAERKMFGALNMNSNYRVLNPYRDLAGDGETPYFHKSIGGYHGAKLRRYQDLISFYLDRESQMVMGAGRQGRMPDTKQLPILNMLNTRYLIINPGSDTILNPEDPNTINRMYQWGVVYNNDANGNAWFVKGVKVVKTANDEILALKGFNTKDSAIVSEIFSANVEGWDIKFDNDAEIKLTSYKPNHLVYEVSNADEDQLALFSEIYYPLGWNAYIDGKKVDHFQANYVLRALRVPAGTSKIEFKYELSSFGWTNKVAMASSIIVILMVLAALYLEIRTKAANSDASNEQA